MCNFHRLRATHLHSKLFYKHIKQSFHNGRLSDKPTQRLTYVPDRSHRTVTRPFAKSQKAFVPSLEQQAVVQTCYTHNVLVSARPGTGKTATAEAIVSAYPEELNAVLLYNKSLQIDTAARLSKYSNVDASTFHRMAGELFGTVVRNDTVLRSLRRKGDIPIWTGKPYHRIILDELQDCTDDIFWLVCSFISAITKAGHGRIPQVVVLGDGRQAIYGFQGADPRFLSLAPSIMTKLSPRPWVDRTLSESFRLTHENSAFVNKVFLGGEDYIIGSRRGPKPIYLVAKPFDVKVLAAYLLPFIYKYGAEETAFLAPSVRRNPPLQGLVNHLSEEYGILVAEPLSEDSPLDDDVLRGKICVSTYHQFKGKERKLVVVYGIEDSYFTYHARDLPDHLCPNTTFVALTRAREQLIVLQGDKDKPMPFIDMAELENTADIVELGDVEGLSLPGDLGRPLELGLLLPKSVSASELSRHIISEILENICTKHLKISKITEPLPIRQHIRAPSTVCTDPDPDKRYEEAVSDINGLAVVAHYEFTSFGSLSTLQKKKKSVSAFKKLSNDGDRAKWLCREACKYAAKVSGYMPRVRQMKGHDFGWLASYLAEATQRLNAQFPEGTNLGFEVSLRQEDFRMDNVTGEQSHTTKLYGRTDIIQYEHIPAMGSPRKVGQQVVKHTDSDNVSIWEIKFVSQLSLDHIIQACTYAYLWCEKHKPLAPPRLFLFNVRDGEKWEIVPRGGISAFKKVVDDALAAKYSTKEMLTTEEFLEKCAKTEAEVEKNGTKIREAA